VFITVKEYGGIIMEYVTLSNGVKMPVLGYGVYQVTKDECERCVMDALEVGYRSLDTAQSYFNEEEVGSAMKKSGIPREEIFLTSKVWVEHYGYEETRKSVEESLRKLQTDYLDLMLLHQPFNDYYGAYRALEDMYDEGKLRAIGVSNFYPDRLVDLASFTRIPPMINQIETHVLNQRTEDNEWMGKYHIAHEAWAPFGEGRGGLFENKVLKQIGDKYGKTTAQVMLRWNIQRGVIVLPKTTHKERMIQNLDVFDFSLTDEDMGAIAELDTKTSAFFSHYDPNMVEWFVKMVEERKKQHDSSKEKKNW
jgi:2,5-diketo-D-gluconate reductase A